MLLCQCCGELANDVSRVCCSVCSCVSVLSSVLTSLTHMIECYSNSRKLLLHNYNYLHHCCVYDSIGRVHLLQQYTRSELCWKTIPVIPHGCYMEYNNVQCVYQLCILSLNANKDRMASILDPEEIITCVNYMYM
jgi:hypothetical protein